MPLDVENSAQLHLDQYNSLRNRNPIASGFLPDNRMNASHDVTDKSA